MFRNTRIWGLEFSPFYVSVCFETIESVDLDIFSLFQYVSVSLLYNLYVSMFRNTRIWGLEFSACFNMFQSVYYIIYIFQCFETPEYGVWNFHLFMFQFVLKRFETIESLDLDIFSLFQHGNTWSYLFQYCVETFRNR